MPLDLTPLSAGTESLTPAAPDTQTLTPASGEAETLTPLIEQDAGFEFLYPGPLTFPGATTYPGEYGAEVGFRLTVLPEAAETLTPLTED